MSTYKKDQATKIAVFCILLLVCMGLTITTSAYYSANTGYKTPPFETNAIAGMPPKGPSEGYGIINSSFGYAIGISSACELENGRLTVYFANPDSNCVWLSLAIVKIVDGKVTEIVAETGIIKPGQYIEWMKIPDGHTFTDEVFLIKSYAPETYVGMGEEIVEIIFNK